MERQISAELWELAAGLTAGAGLGLVYELLYPLRGLGRGALRIVWDILYALIAVCWLFLGGLAQTGGAAAGFLLAAAVGWVLLRWLIHALEKAISARGRRGGEAQKNKQ